MLPGSLPIVSFGDPDTASVATLSLNPSWIEFERPRGGWLHGSDRRVASLTSIGVTDPRELDDDQVSGVVCESHRYFKGPNWYKAWFHWLETMLSRSGAGSYLNGSACHLDLVQWATKPAQGGLDPAVWDGLVAEDHEFLHWQLQTSGVSVVLMNGASVVRWVERAGLLAAAGSDRLRFQTKAGPREMPVYHGIAEGVLFLSWNTPLASPISADGREKLIAWVADHLRQRSPAAPRRAAGALSGEPGELR